MQIRGSEALFALYHEIAFGQTPGSPDGKKIYPTAFGLKVTQGRTASNTLSGLRAREEGFLDNQSVAGSISGEVAPEWIGLILKHALGTLTTSGTGPYTHTFGIGALPEGILFEVDHGSKISGAGRYIRHAGCRINQLTLDFPQSGPVTFSADLMGATTTAYAAPLDATITDYGHTGFGAFEASIQEGGAAIATCKKLTVTIANNLDGDGYVIGGQGARAAMPEGFTDVTATGTFLFTDASLLNKALAGTETSLAVTLTRGDGLGSAGNESLVITLPQGKYDKTNPEITGPAGILVELTFKAYRKGATLPMAVALKNAVATL